MGVPPTFFARISKQATYILFFDKNIILKDLIASGDVLITTDHITPKTAATRSSFIYSVRETIAVAFVFASILTEGSTRGWLTRCGSRRSRREIRGGGGARAREARKNERGSRAQLLDRRTSPCASVGKDFSTGTGESLARFSSNSGAFVAY